jgi:uncharacterized protein
VPGSTPGYRRRIVDALLRERLASSGAVLVEGPKACGKTSSAERVAGSSVHLDVDEGALSALAVDPILVLSGASPRLIDEWQLDATRVWNQVRREVDRRGAPGQFILTGSAVPPDDQHRHTGAGRFARLVMRPMSLTESGESNGSVSLAALFAGQRTSAVATQLGAAQITELLVRGGWPLNLDRSAAEALRNNKDYLRTIAEVDISRVDAGRRDPDRVRRMIEALARNVAMEQKVSRLASEVGGPEGPLARTTAYEILGGLRRLMVIEEQPAWATHLRSRAVLRTAQRTHFVDPSLAAAALNAGPKRLLADLNFLGLLFESLVVRDCRIYADPLDAHVSHYRDSDGLEVDIVIQRNDGAWGAFEVKLGDSAIDEAARNLLSFAEKVDQSTSGPPSFLGIVTTGEYAFVRPDGVQVIPIGALGP